MDPSNQDSVDPTLISGVFVIFVVIVTSGGLVVITGDLVVSVAFSTKPGPACVSGGSALSV